MEKSESTDTESNRVELQKKKGYETKEKVGWLKKSQKKKEMGDSGQ